MTVCTFVSTCIRPKANPATALGRALTGLLALVCFCLLSARVYAAGDPPIENIKPVRSTTRWGEGLLAEGCKKSTSFRRLVQTLHRTAVIVYVEPVREMGGLMRASTSIAGVGGPFRYLRVSLGMAATRKKLIALIAHELQHATEIAAAPEVVDDATMAEYYRRIGDRNLDGYDTAAARDMGDVVWSELWTKSQPGDADPDEASADPGPINRRPTRASASVDRRK